VMVLRPSIHHQGCPGKAIQQAKVRLGRGIPYEREPSGACRFSLQ